jgi:hypothetical protein
MNFPNSLDLATPLDHRTRPLTNFARSSKSTYDNEIVHMLSPCHILYGNKLYYYIKSQDTYKNFLSHGSLWRTRHKRGFFLSCKRILSFLTALALRATINQHPDNHSDLLLFLITAQHGICMVLRLV